MKLREIEECYRVTKETFYKVRSKVGGPNGNIYDFILEPPSRPKKLMLYFSLEDLMKKFYSYAEKQKVQTLYVVVGKDLMPFFRQTEKDIPEIIRAFSILHNIRPFVDYRQQEAFDEIPFFFDRMAFLGTREDISIELILSPYISGDEILVFSPEKEDSVILGRVLKEDCAIRFLSKEQEEESYITHKEGMLQVYLKENGPFSNQK